jgi:hypothetical protein
MSARKQIEQSQLSVAKALGGKGALSLMWV